MILVSICLVLAGVLIPVAAKLPKLLEAEIVLAAFWLVWVVALTWLLFRGHKVEDDAFWTGVGAKGKKSLLNRWDGCGDVASGCGDLGCIFDEGCGSIVLAVVAFLLLGLAFLLLIELVVPAIALLLLASIGGMFARAVNDNHHCEGRFFLSLLWGAIWSTLYIGPVAGIVIWVISQLPKAS